MDYFLYTISTIAIGYTILSVFKRWQKKKQEHSEISNLGRLALVLKDLTHLKMIKNPNVNLQKSAYSSAVDHKPSESILQRHDRYFLLSC